MAGVTEQKGGERCTSLCSAGKQCSISPSAAFYPFVVVLQHTRMQYGVDEKQNDTDHPDLTFNGLENK